MKKTLKVAGIILGALFLSAVVLLWIKHEPLPEGQAGPQADALAKKMLNALNHRAYKETRYLEWSFRNGANRYVWDKDLGKAKVVSAKVTVNLNLNDPSSSKVLKNGKKVHGPDRKKEIEQALDKFNNDSFWLVAPYKVFDKGTQRSLVTLADGSEALLVTYTSGGTTPGDSYLWLLNEDGFPYAYKMWAKIIPIGGIEATWDDWLVTQSGAFLPKSHELGPLTLELGNVKGYN